MPVTVFASSVHASRAAAMEIADLIRRRASEGRMAVLGLATGSSPQGVYEELVRMHVEEGLSFRNVVTFNLDEYYPMGRAELQSYHRFMREHLFDHVDIAPENVHIPDGTLAHDRVGAFCQKYEREIGMAGRMGESGAGAGAGGIDLQLLGIGRSGHIGFNEPGSSPESRTRLITLDRVTRIDAASDFFGEWNVPRRAITMGVGTILAARRIILMAFGEHKASVVRRAVEGEIDPSVAASFLQRHRSAGMYLDPASAAELTRFRTPWKLGPVSELGLEWNSALTRKAVIWLALETNKPILNLTSEDYNEHHLQELLATRPGGAYDLNIEVFKSMQATITGWPGGRPERRGSGRRHDDQAGAGEREGARHRAAAPKRIVVFSPHPDDDVISMGGTLIRLCEQGHDVHVAYQTSGNIAVFDDSAVRHAEFVAEFCREFGLFSASDARRIEEQVLRFVRTKEPGEIDSTDVQKIKAIIRRSEARAGARYSGVKPRNVHFLDMPFYETGRVRKKPLSRADISTITGLLERVKPQQIYAAGDLSDPHGTHRVCLAAVIAGLCRLSESGAAWARACELWLYRGAWQEWEPDRIEMAVPLSPEEVDRKRTAIFKHESQKDRALFPGPDAREFWQRAEDRNRHTAMVYDRLGLPQYQAIEGFVRWREDTTPMVIMEPKAGVRARRGGGGKRAAGAARRSSRG